MTETKKKQPRDAVAGEEVNKTRPIDEASWKAMQAQALEAPNILPKLDFGEDRMEEVVRVVRFLESSPRVVEYIDPYTEEDATALAMNVHDCLHQSDRSLMMRNDVTHTLTKGILRLAAAHGGDLKGVKARIETAKYMHKRYGLTRKYVVSEITEEPVGPEATP